MSAKLVLMTVVFLTTLPASAAVSRDQNTASVCSETAQHSSSSASAKESRDTSPAISVIQTKPLALEIVDKDGRSVRIALPEELYDVAEFRRCSANRIVIVGRINGDAAGVVVIDPVTTRIVDKFYAYAPAISPDARRIVFIKFFPSHFVEGTDDHYMVYDLAMTPGGNRPDGVALSDAVDVGKPIYPDGVANREGDNTGVPENLVHSFASDRFFWMSSREFIFADYFQGNLSVVRVAWSLQESAQPPDVTVHSLRRAQICPEKAIDCTLHLNEVEQTYKGIDLRFKGIGTFSWINSSVLVQLDQFLPQ